MLPLLLLLQPGVVAVRLQMREEVGPVPMPGANAAAAAAAPVRALSLAASHSEAATVPSSSDESSPGHRFAAPFHSRLRYTPGGKWFQPTERRHTHTHTGDDRGVHFCWTAFVAGGQQQTADSSGCLTAALGARRTRRGR